MAARSAPKSRSAGDPPRLDMSGGPKLPLFRLILALAMVPGMYVIMAVLVAIMAALAGGAGYGLWAWIQMFSKIRSIKLFVLVMCILFMVTIGGLTGLWIMLRALIASVLRDKHSELGLLIDMDGEKELWGVLAPLCRQVGCRPPDSVILVAEPNFYVTRGPVHVVNGKARGRVLAIGAPWLGVLPVNEFRAIMAHEMAHFTGRDTLFSRLALPVYNGTIEAVRRIALEIKKEYSTGKPSYAKLFPLMPAYWTLNLYGMVFHLINCSISRAREFRADYVSALVAGRAAAGRALMRVSAISPFFYQDFPARLLQGNNGVRPANMFVELPRHIGEAKEALKNYGAQAMQESGTRFDDHPSLKARIDALPATPDPAPDDRRLRDLFAKPELYELPLSKIMIPLMERNLMATSDERERRVR